MKKEALPWIITCLVLVAAIVMGGILWQRDRATQAGAKKEAARHHAAMLFYVDRADSLGRLIALHDSGYAQAMRDFATVAASLEEHHLQADARQAVIESAPADSLPAIVRRLLATSYALGYVRNSAGR